MHKRRQWIYPVRRWLLCGSVLLSLDAVALETRHFGALSIEPTVNMRLGMQYGTGINFGYGAIDDPGETERSSASMSIKPRIGLAYQTSPGTQLYAAVSAAAATTTLDGEIGGQYARSGDADIDTDDLHIGWRNEMFDLSVGAQEFWVGDGFLIGDGNLDTGKRDGQFWNFPFAAWRNSAILKFNTEHVHGDVFWLRSDQDFGDSRVVGINLENKPGAYAGVFGFMYLEIIDGNALHFDGIELWNLRAHKLSVPGVEHLTLWGEVAIQRGTDEDGGGRDNAALGWYLEGAYEFAALPWKPILSYRYIHLSGDDPDSADNEEFRGLFYTFYKREWDTWYQGEIAGEYHLFNQNQVTQMVKLRTFPVENWALTLYYYRHDLEQAQYFGTPLSSTAWADEINLSVEYFHGESFYGYAGIAWSRPDEAAQEVYGRNDDFTVIQTFLMYTF